MGVAPEVVPLLLQLTSTSSTIGYLTGFFAALYLHCTGEGGAYAYYLVHSGSKLVVSLCTPMMHIAIRVWQKSVLCGLIN